MDLVQKPFYLNETQIKNIYETLDSMSLQQKVGQLFCVLGDAYTEEMLKVLVRDNGIGGILFRPSPRQHVLSSYEELDALATIPLLKAANLEEGGSGAISDGTYFASQLQVAATDDTNCCEKFAGVCAAEGAICRHQLDLFAGR